MLGRPRCSSSPKGPRLFRRHRHSSPSPRALRTARQPRRQLPLPHPPHPPRHFPLGHSPHLPLLPRHLRSRARPPGHRFLRPTNRSRRPQDRHTGRKRELTPLSCSFARANRNRTRPPYQPDSGEDCPRCRTGCAAPGAVRLLSVLPRQIASGGTLCRLDLSPVCQVRDIFVARMEGPVDRHVVLVDQTTRFEAGILVVASAFRLYVPLQRLAQARLAFTRVSAAAKILRRSNRLERRRHRHGGWRMTWARPIASLLRHDDAADDGASHKSDRDQQLIGAPHRAKSTADGVGVVEPEQPKCLPLGYASSSWTRIAGIASTRRRPPHPPGGGTGGESRGLRGCGGRRGGTAINVKRGSLCCASGDPRTLASDRLRRQPVPSSLRRREPAGFRSDGGSATPGTVDGSSEETWPTRRPRGW